MSNNVLKNKSLSIYLVLFKKLMILEPKNKILKYNLFVILHISIN